MRQEVCLNGAWQIEVEGIEGAHDVRVPGSFAGQNKLWGQEHWNTWDYPEAWFGRAATYHKTFTLPSPRNDAPHMRPEGQMSPMTGAAQMTSEGQMTGQRVLIRFNGVRHVVRVAVNGREIGRWSDSYVPFTFDITDLVQPGENALAVHIGAETTCGLFEDYNTNRRGIYRDVFLQVLPEVRVDDDVYLQTLLREKRLNIALTLRNDGGIAQEVALRFSITDPEGNVVKQWEGDQTMTLEAGGTRRVKVSEPWEDPHLWSIDDPFLYHIHTEVMDAAGDVTDRHTLRFGFREISWVNARLYLNGEELYLRGNGNHPMGDLEGGKPFAEAMIRHLKAYGVQSMRMHDLGRHQEMYEAGDELGFLFIAEASHHFRLPPEDVGKAHMECFVKYLWNHPSVLAWSVSNELHWRKFEEPAYLVELCNQLDPTRPAFASDFTPWSLHGNVVAHHYSPESIWSDWLQYGKDKAMIWDELGDVWQHDRNLDTGPAGYEVYGQDVATGIYRDGMEIVRNLDAFADGKMIDGELRRVSFYAPWEFGYNFFRFQPFNNMQKMRQTYDCIEGTKGIKIDSVMPGASTVNIWDPTLPSWQPNPGLYCFKEFLECVRFPDDPKERTWFAGDELSCSGRIFYETHMPADKVSFLVELPDGEVLSDTSRAVSLRPGTYIEAFSSSWQLPHVDGATPVRLVREFARGDKVVYRQTRDIKLFPCRRAADLLPDNATVIGEALQSFFGTSGAESSDSQVVIADAMSDTLIDTVKRGGRVLILPAISPPEAGPQTATIEMDTSMESVGQEFVYHLSSPLALDQEGWFKITNHQTTKVHGEKNPEQPWLEERTLWSNSPESYQPQFQVRLHSISGEVLVSSPDTPLTLSRVQCAPSRSEEKFLLDDFEWLWDEEGGEASRPASVDALPPVSEIVMVLTRMPGTEVEGRLQSLQLFGATRPKSIFPTNGARPTFLDGLGDEDLALWRGGSAVEALKLPEERSCRRFLFGNKHGRGSSLHEWVLGKGLVMETSLNLVGTFDEEPAAGEFLLRCLERLRSFEPVGEVAPVAVIGDEALLAYARGLGVDCELLTEPEDLQGRPLIIVGATSKADATELVRWKAVIKKAVAAGGRAHFTPLTDATLEIVREITGRPELALTEPFFHKTTLCIKAPVSWARVNSPEILVDTFDGVLMPYPFEPNFSPLLSGLANIDLDWGGVSMFEQGIELKGMDPVAASADVNILISNWHINSEPGKSIFGEMLNGVRDLRQNTWFVNRDPVVLEVSGGRGSFIFNQLTLENGGEAAKRLMCQFLTQLGAPISGTAAPAVGGVYNLTPRARQIEQFAVYARQIDTARRQYYGIPKPMPAYLKETRLDAAENEALPSLGFVGDKLSVQLAHPLGDKLSDVLQPEEPVEIDALADAVAALNAHAGESTWDRVVLSVGNTAAREEKLSPERFAQHLREVYAALKPRAQQIFWLPTAPAAEADAELCQRIAAYNLEAEKVFGGDEVYMVPFVYDSSERVLYDFLHGAGHTFSLQELRDLSTALAEAVRSFGAM